MRLLHPEHPERQIWLGYCLNVHPGDTLEAILGGLEELTVPLRARLAPDQPFGIGLYLPAAVAHRVVREEEARDALRAALDDVAEAASAESLKMPNSVACSAST